MAGVRAREGVVGMSTFHVVGFSGGIDSQACALWVRERFPAEEIILLNSDAGGNEHPITEAFIRLYSDTVFPVTVVKAEIRDMGTAGTAPGRIRDRRNEFEETDTLTFDRLAYLENRFPSRKAQFCTTYLKLHPQRRWLDENLGAKGHDWVRYVGVRRDESVSRRDTPDSKWDEYFDCDLHYPVASWTKQQCFDYCLAAGEPVNPLYTLGFGRVGCAPCINSSKQDIRNWVSRFPEMIDKVREWEVFVGRTFFPPCVPGMKINFIDDVVAWSRTTRGGSVFQLQMLGDENRPEACSSKYGLCE